MPSYRPQAKIRWSSPASSYASAWLNGVPAGDGTTSVPGSTDRRAAYHGSGRMTMPGPPPYGVSSTVRCTSDVQVRRSSTEMSSSPAARALPINDRSSGPKYSGKIVMMSTRIGLEIQQALGKIGDHSPRGQVDGRDHGGDERYERRPATGPGQDDEIGGRGMVDARDRTEQCAVRCLHPQPDQLMIEKLVRVVRRCHGRAVHLQQHTAEGLGDVTVVDPVEPRDHPALMPADGFQRELLRYAIRHRRCGRGRTGVHPAVPWNLRGEHRSGGEPRLRLVGPHGHQHLSLDPVWPADDTDDEELCHVRLSTRRRC